MVEFCVIINHSNEHGIYNCAIVLNQGFIQIEFLFCKTRHWIVSMRFVDILVVFLLLISRHSFEHTIATRWKFKAFFDRFSFGR